MKETGIIMSGDHPKLILEQKKTMTRRIYGLEVVNQFPDDWRFVRMEGDLAVFLLLKKHLGDIVPARSRSREIRGEEPNLEFLFKCPYGGVGDTLIIKETWATNKQYDHLKPADIPDIAKIYYIDKHIRKAGDYSLFIEIGKTRSSLFMSRWASRIERIITLLRAERLRDITKADAKAEGNYSVEEFIKIFLRLNHLPEGANPWNWVIGW